MHDPIKYLETDGFDIQYPTRAIDVLNARCVEWTKEQYVAQINETLGDIDCTDLMVNLDVPQSKYTYFYVVQTLLNTNKKQLIVESAWLMQDSIERATELCRTHRVAIYEESESMFNDVSSTATKATVSKGDRAYELFCELMTPDNIDDTETRKAITDKIRLELDMSDSGSRTYFHSSKKKYKKQNKL